MTVKRICALLICCSLVFSCFVPVCAQTTAWPVNINSTLPFDLDGNGAVDTADARDMLLPLVSDVALSAHDIALGDYNFDGDCTTTDVRHCLEQVLGSSEKRESISFDVEYVNYTASLNTNQDVEVLTSYEQWSEFKDRFDSIRYFGGNTDFENDALICVPYSHEDEYVSLITADETTVHISMVRMEDSRYIFTDRTCYAQITVAADKIADKTIEVHRYYDTESKLIFAQNVTNYKLGSIQFSSSTCTCDHNAPIALESTADCERYIELHKSPSDTQRDPIESSAFEAYDELFFEDNILMGLYFNHPAGFDFTVDYVTVGQNTISATCIYENIIGEGEGVLAHNISTMLFIPVPREYYNGQMIIPVWGFS